jgi:hypothetical protein
MVAGMNSPASTLTPSSDVNDVVATFASNNAFRSAQADELINVKNPFRRPVRPHDLPMLDFHLPLARAELLSLSALLGHRILMNAYESEYLFLPDAEDAAASKGFREFYDADSVALGELARPALERHLFAFLEPTARERAVDMADVRRRLSEIEHELTDLGEELCATIRARRDPRAAAVFTLVQLTCGWRARASACERAMIGDWTDIHPRAGELARASVAEARAGDRQLRETLEAAELLVRPRAYWQFYLTSTLAALNNLYRLARDHGRFFELLGAAVHAQLSQWAGARSLAPALDELVGAGAGSGVDDATPEQRPYRGGQSSSIVELAEALCELYGRGTVVEALLTGLENAHELALLGHDDLSRQLIWADNLDHYKAEARRLQSAIDRKELVVDLDTFVESSEETSTTHVHDEHRLVVIEQGAMHFWNNVGSTIPLSTGEMVLVPRTRLHGSVVLSGECTYHQPIIPEEHVIYSSD